MPPLYHFDEGAMPVPAGFRDVTVNMFEWLLPGGRCTLMVQREARRPDEAFEVFVERITTAHATRFPGFAEAEPKQVSSQPRAVTWRFRWRNERESIHQHEAFVDVGERVLCMTASGPERLHEEIDRVLERALRGLRRRES